MFTGNYGNSQGIFIVLWQILLNVARKPNDISGNRKITFLITCITQRIPVIIFRLKFAVSFEWLYHMQCVKLHNKPGNVFRNPTPRMPIIIFFFFSKASLCQNTCKQSHKKQLINTMHVTQGSCSQCLNNEHF